MNLLVSFSLLSCVLLSLNAQRLDHSACPDGVKYIYISPKKGWIGLGWAWTQQSFRLHNTTLELDFATVDLGNAAFLGNLQIISFAPVKTTNTKQRYNLVYEAIFPTQNPVPEITKVVLNGDTLCNNTAREHNDEKPHLVKMHLMYNDYSKEQILNVELEKKPEPIKLQSQNQPTIQLPTDSDALGCGKVDKKNIYVPLVLEGSTIQRGTWPWLVSIYAYSKLRLGFNCGATLISRKLVVTAAHCFFDQYNRLIKIDDVLIILGQYNLKRPQDQGTQIIYPQSVNIHPNYRKRNNVDSDLAVVVVSEPVTYTTFIRPACLWTGSSSKEEIIGLKGFSAGWGRDEHGHFFTELPKQIEIPVVSDETCLRSNLAFTKITSDKTFCAGWRNGTEGPCNGDSGGGLIFDRNGRWTLRGVVSTALSTDGSNTCNLNEYVVFTDVAQFTDWILSFEK
ncbi:hypothetical protein DMENIID0001_072780 [Sergentomyia squamirostris]